MIDILQKKYFKWNIFKFRVKDQKRTFLCAMESSKFYPRGVNELMNGPPNERHKNDFFVQIALNPLFL